MPVIYIKNLQGQHQYGLPLDDLYTATDLALEVLEIAPKILITDESDLIVFEACDGVVTFPTNIDFSNAFETESPSFHEEFLDAKGADDLEDLIDLVNDAETGTIESIQYEMLLLSLAARMGINLFSDNVPPLMVPGSPFYLAD